MKASNNGLTNFLVALTTRRKNRFCRTKLIDSQVIYVFFVLNFNFHAKNNLAKSQSQLSVYK